jgi:hypothetical protein
VGVAEQLVEVEGSLRGTHQLSQGLELLTQGQPKAEEEDAQLLQYLRVEAEQGLADEQPAQPVSMA